MQERRCTCGHARLPDYHVHCSTWGCTNGPRDEREKNAQLRCIAFSEQMTVNSASQQLCAKRLSSGLCFVKVRAADGRGARLCGVQCETAEPGKTRLARQDASSHVCSLNIRNDYPHLVAHIDKSNLQVRPKPGFV